MRAVSSCSEPNSSSASGLENKKEQSKAYRIFVAALPFIALHKPYGRVIDGCVNLSRIAVSSVQFTKKQEILELLKIVVAVTALAGTIFAHPAGLFIGTLFDLGIDFPALCIALRGGNYEALLPLVDNLLYLMTLVVGSVELVVLSLLISIIVQILSSRNEFKGKRYIEGVAHLLMSVVRFGQTVPCVNQITQKHNIRGKDSIRSFTETMAKVRDCTSICFYLSARFFVAPLFKSTSLWLNSVSVCKDSSSSTIKKVCSVAKSTILSSVLLPLTLSGFAIGQAFHFTAFNLATTPYIHLKGTAEVQELPEQEFSVFQLNCCLTAGEFAKLFGGMKLSDRQRMVKIAQMIRDAKPNIACLQEVSDLETGFSLYKKLSSQFAEFYFHIGATPFILQNNSGLFVASQYKVIDPEFHSFQGISGVETMVNKGYFLFSIGRATIINTHLSPSSDDSSPSLEEIDTRKQELTRIQQSAKKRSDETQKPVYGFGDYNTNGAELEPLCDGVASGSSCETEYLVARNFYHDKNTQPKGLVLDHVLVFSSGDSTLKTKALATFDTADPGKAISDHPALISVIRDLA